MPNSAHLHRVLRAPSERVYRAFPDADAKAKWLAPHRFTGKVPELEATVGGTYLDWCRTNAFAIATGSRTRTG
jgi:uncharacterized protein YndB with AHSA1/START domain